MIKKKVIKIIEEKEKDKEEEKPKVVKPKKPPLPKIKKLYSPKYLANADKEDAADTFNFAAERQLEHTTKICEATSHLVSESLTACLLCLNELYLRNGFVSSILINVLLACVTAYCLYSLTRSAQKVYVIGKIPMITYPELAQASADLSSFPVTRKYGRKFKNTIIAVIVVRLVAKCCVYQFIMARSLHHLILRVSDTSPETTRKYLGILMPPCILVSMLRTIDYTAPFSFVSYAFLVVIFIYIMCFGLLAPPLKFTTYKYINDVPTIFSFCGGCVFIMDSSCAILSVENNMNSPKKIYLVIIIGMLIVTIATICMGVVGSYGWGYKSKAPITLNFKVRIIPYTDFFQIGLCLSAYNSFALDFWVLFKLLWAHLKILYPPEKYRIFEPMTRAGFTLAITMLGMLFPDLSGMMSLFGALASGLLNFIFPPIIEFLISTRGKRFGKLKWKVLRLVAITTFGWIFILGGTFCGLRDIFVNVYFVPI